MTEAENTGFLYPFIESEETDATSLLDDLAASRAGQGRRKRPPATASRSTSTPAR